MRHRKNYAAIDNFRLVAAVLIVAIHTAPLASFSNTADFLVTYCFGRIGVPFFLMVTGFFVLAPYQRKYAKRFSSGQSEMMNNEDSNRIGIGSVGRFLGKTAILYGISTLLYFPLKLYSKNLSDSVGGWLKEIFFDGTFHHLWYLPAVILGCLLLVALLRFCSPLTISAVVFILYIFGVLGDSYYGLVSEVPFFKIVYEGIFQVSSYTRNGIFFAPVFLWLGVVLANSKIKISREHASVGFAVSMAAMLAEGFLSFHFQWQKHNSLYFLLLPVMFFLFEMLLSMRGPEIGIARELSMYIYILHPLCIVVVRGAAGVLKMSELLVEQSLIHYLAVVLVSVLLSLAVVMIKRLFSERTFSIL